LKVIIPSVLGFHLSQYVRCFEVVLWLGRRLLVLSEVLLRCINVIMILRRSMKRLRLEHLPNILKTLLKLLLFISSIE
jgi:hypothetical protein